MNRWVCTAQTSQWCCNYRHQDLQHTDTQCQLRTVCLDVKSLTFQELVILNVTACSTRPSCIENNITSWFRIQTHNLFQVYRLIAAPSDTLWVHKVVWIITIYECADNGVKQNITTEYAKQSQASTWNFIPQILLNLLSRHTIYLYIYTLWVHKVVWIIIICECADNGIKQNISTDCAQFSGFIIELHSVKIIKITYFRDTQYIYIYNSNKFPRKSMYSVNNKWHAYVKG